MIINAKDLAEYANGIVETNVTEKGIELNRFTKTQTEKFYKGNRFFDIVKEPFFDGYFGRNCRTMSSVKMDFITDAKKMIVKIGDNEGTNGTGPMNLDVYVNGKIVSSPAPDRDFEIKLFGGKEKNITIYMPYFNFTIIQSIEFEGETMVKPKKEKIEILSLGDSITHGASATHMGNIWTSIVGRKLGVGLLNQANSGFVFDYKVLEKVSEPKIITVAYGINDQGRKPREDFRQDAIDYVAKLKELYPNAKIVGIVPIWTVPEKEKENRPFTNESRSILKKVYEDFGCIVVDGLKLVPHDEKYYQDIVHPNEEGQKYYGGRMAKILADLIY